ncbi:MAG TPA: NADPH-dependent F420 reductase [Anaerolineales bacterium]|nr:NADPH-dependent F420 reductase [Anaerolineales bacterium]
MSERLILTLGIIGGTGNEGKGLAYRWAKAGYYIIIGSRSPPRAEEAAAEINTKAGVATVRGLGNAEAAAQCDIAVLTVPYDAHRAILEEIRAGLKGKVLVDVTVPIRPPSTTVLHVPPEGSAAAEAQSVLGDDVEVVAAFHNISHVHLAQDGPVPCDVLVAGRSAEARKQVLHLVEAARMVGWDAGPLENAVVLEGLTPILLGINKQYGLRAAGIRIAGEPRSQRK